MSNLAKPFSLQLTKDQHKAFEILKNYGFNKNILIRKAVDEILHREFRSVLKELKAQAVNSNTPDWAI